MQATVPFVHGLIDAQASAWLEAMRSAAPDLDFRFLSDVSAQERKEVEVAVVANPEPATLAELPKLKWVQSLWAGVDRILREMPDPSVQIVRLIDPQLGETMAEAVLAWTLYLHRDMPRYAAQQRDRLWVQHDLPTAAERSVGLLGLGHLGQSAADRLKKNGFTVRGWSRSAKQIPEVATFDGADGLAEIARTSDILVVLLPSTPQTRGLLGHGFFADMKPGASLINFARGDILVQDALTAGLEARLVDHAVLDVFMVEPLPETDLLWSNPNVTILPHISAPTNKRSASAVVARNLTTYFTDRHMPVPVSRDAGY